MANDPRVLDFKPEDYSVAAGVDVKIDRNTGNAYLVIDRGLELPVRVMFPFQAVCQIAGMVLLGLQQPPGNGSAAQAAVDA